MSTVTKADLARILAEDLSCPLVRAKELVDAFFGALAGAIIEGNRIEVRGFGVWEVKESNPKHARNPKTGEHVFVPARWKVRFKPGKALREVLGQPRKASCILVIDDEAIVRAPVRTMLEMAGYEVLEAADGEEGIQKYRQNPADAVIVDVFLPGKSGLEVIEELKRDYPAVRLIAISGAYIRDEFDMVSLIGRYGILHTLEKPFGMRELLGVVKEVLGEDQEDGGV